MMGKSRYLRMDTFMQKHMLAMLSLDSSRTEALCLCHDHRTLPLCQSLAILHASTRSEGWRVFGPIFFVGVGGKEESWRGE